MKFLNKIGNILDMLEKKAISPKGLSALAFLIVLTTFVVSCNEKMSNPYSNSSSSSDTLAYAGVKTLTETSNNIASSETSISVIQHEDATPSVQSKDTTEIKPVEVKTEAVSAIPEVGTAIMDSITKSEREKVKRTLKPPTSIATSEKINPLHTGRNYVRSGSKGLGLSECPCLQKEKVDGPTKTASFFSRKYGLTMDKFVSMQKSAVFTGNNHKLKKGVFVCLKRDESKWAYKPKKNTH